MLYRFISDFNYTSIIRSFLHLRYWYIAQNHPETLHFDDKAGPRHVYFLNKYVDISPYVNESMIILLDGLNTRYSRPAWRDDLNDITRCLKWLRSIEK